NWNLPVLAGVLLAHVIRPPALHGFAPIFILVDHTPVRGAWTARLVSYPRATAMVAGMVPGASLIFEYNALFVVVPVAIYALARLPRRLLLWLALGAVPPLLVILAYDWAAYGNSLRTGYSAGPPYFPEETKGLAGFTWPPRPSALYG